MGTIAPSRPACSILLLRKWVPMLAVALAAILLHSPGALADLENQKEIDKAVTEYSEAVKQARDNIPDSAAMKRAEDALDVASRAKVDADAKLKAAEESKLGEAEIAKAKQAADSAEEAEKAAKRAADAARAAETSEADKERAKNYREALDKRRAARSAMQALWRQLRPMVGKARLHGNAEELLQEINRLQIRITRSEQPITPQSVAALTPFLPMTANVATDSQALCTFGKATPTSVALEPSDNDGNPLKKKLNAALNRALTALLAPPPGGGAAPINISNPDPDNAAKQNKPEKEKGGAGPTTATGGPQAPGAGAADPKTAGKADATPAPAAGPPAGRAASADVLGGSILDQIDESKTAHPPVGATASRPPAEPAPSTGPKRPPDTGLGLKGTKLPNGEAPEDAIDRLSKLADEARTRGDKSGFEFSRAAVLSVAQWVQDRIAEGLPPPGELGEMMQGGFTPPQNLSEAAKQIQARDALDLLNQWTNYGDDISRWRFEPGSASAAVTPGTAAGPPTSTPSPDSGPAAKPNPDTTPPRSATSGEKSAPAPEKSAGNDKSEKAGIPDKTPTPAGAADPGNISTDQVTIIFKVAESVLQGGSQGDETKTVMAKFTAPEPALPKTGQSKTAKAKLDTGHDRSPVTCNTGAEGRCKAQIPADERESYGLPALPPAAGLQDKTAAGADNDPLLEFVKAYSAIQASQNYSVELPLARNTGMVIQKGPAKPTSALLAALADVPPGVQVQKSDFKIGNKTYTRVGFTGPAALTAEAAKKFADRLGNDAQIDQCGEKAPGPPLGMVPVSFSALNSELPHATVDLRKSVRSRGATQ